MSHDSMEAVNNHDKWKMDQEQFVGFFTKFFEAVNINFSGAIDKPTDGIHIFHEFGTSSSLIILKLKWLQFVVKY